MALIAGMIVTWLQKIEKLSRPSAAARSTVIAVDGAVVSNPTYLVDDVVHYCVTNMPGAVARTSTFALNNMTLPFVLTLAGEGARRALGEDVHLRNGLNVYDGMVTHRAVADALKLKYTPAEAALRL